jgi:hypothetical protein
VIRAFALAVLLLAPGVFAKGSKKPRKAKEPIVQAQVVFPDVPLSKLQVADTRGAQALVLDKAGGGDVVLVRAGDLLGEEGYQVVNVSRGCMHLKGDDAELTMCADIPEVPRT